MTTYVAFDGDKDIWAYGYMKGWSENKRIDFELLDAHDLDNMTARARGEYYVKGKLHERMNKSKAFVLLVGESTRHLHMYVGWEIDLAIELGLPIVVVNLNNNSGLDRDNCPARIRSACAVHIPFKLAAPGTHLIVGQPSSAGSVRRTRLAEHGDIQRGLGRSGSLKRNRSAAHFALRESQPEATSRRARPRWRRSPSHGGANRL
jgi:hypothetical protein